MKKFFSAATALVLSLLLACSLCACSNIFFVSRDFVGDKGDFVVGEEFSPGNIKVTLGDWLDNKSVYTQDDMTFDTSEFDCSRPGTYEIHVTITDIDYKFSYYVRVLTLEDYLSIYG